MNELVADGFLGCGRRRQGVLFGNPGARFACGWITDLVILRYLRALEYHMFFFFLCLCMAGCYWPEPGYFIFIL